MNTSALVRFLDAEYEGKPEARVLDELAAVIDEAGFDYYTLIRQPRIGDNPDELLLDGRWPQGWPEAYVQRKYATVDPMIRYLGHSQKGFRWRESMTAFRSDPHRKRMERMMVDARRFGLEDGYMFPVHGRRGLVGVLSLAGRPVDLSQGQMALMDAVAKKAFWTLLERRDFEASEQLAAPVDIRLTRREMETLGFLADGMTSNEMGTTLGLSAHTVDWYMNGIQNKLQAKNRHHAVAIAFRLGLIP